MPSDCVVNFDNIRTIERTLFRTLFRRLVTKLSEGRMEQACRRLRDASGCRPGRSGQLSRAGARRRQPSNAA